MGRQQQRHEGGGNKGSVRHKTRKGGGKRVKWDMKIEEGWERDGDGEGGGREITVECA